ncbi:M42 family metallopeptidase [Soehngenia saccharolytica]|nr:M42 family metallopeptidase [Soehngenia saccharolytica]
MLLEILTQANGVSGNEKEVRDIIYREVEKYADEIKIDKIGNLIVHKKGTKKSNKKVLFAAHMDEVGLIVTDIDEQGFIKFTTVGGIDKRILVSKTVNIGNKRVPGVIGAKPIHLQKNDERDNTIPLSDLYIDIGVDNRNEAEQLIEIGDYIAFNTKYEEFGDGYIKAKALDDRVGCSILIDLIKDDHIEYDFYAAFTVMEEVGLVGAGPAAYSVKPDISVILEGTVCYEMPELDSHLIPTQLGQGPAISLIDRHSLYDYELREKAIATAKRYNIPYQYRKTSSGGNDAGEIQVSRSGSKTLALSLATRYIHSTASMINKDDYYNTILLIKHLMPILCEGEENDNRF